MTRTLSIVIPCFNESKTVGELLERVLQAPLSSWERDIIVVDDASTDGTRDILRQYESRVRVLYLEKNGGKGTAVREGLKAAKGAYILIQDADLEYDPEDIQRLLVPIESHEADVVFGSRNLRPRERQGAYIPRLGVWFLTQLINGLYGVRLTDVWTCYKLFPANAAHAFAAGRFEAELLFIAALARAKYRFAEVPISYHPRDASEGKKIRYRDGIRAIIVLVVDKLHAR